LQDTFAKHVQDVSKNQLQYHDMTWQFIMISHKRVRMLGISEDTLVWWLTLRGGTRILLRGIHAHDKGLIGDKMAIDFSTASGSFITGSLIITGVPTLSRQ
jgi:hypothetical protein